MEEGGAVPSGVRKAYFPLLGPPPESPRHGQLVQGPLGAEEGLRKWRGRARASLFPRGGIARPLIHEEVLTHAANRASRAAAARHRRSNSLQGVLLCSRPV